MTTVTGDPTTPREPARYGRITPQAYLVRERAAEYRSEYFDGEIEAMAGAPEPHVQISGNIFAHLYFRLPPVCRAMQTEMKVRSEAVNATMYPDVLVACGDRRYVDRRQDVLKNPVVVFEVLSPSTERKDRTTKANAYRLIESLQAYVLVSQKDPRVEVYARSDDGSWPCTVYQGFDAVVQLEAIGCSLSLAEIYRDVLDAPADAASAQSGEGADADHD
jgi:Uma2 family endonuclease